MRRDAKGVAGGVSPSTVLLQKSSSDLLHQCIDVCEKRELVCGSCKNIDQIRDLTPGQRKGVFRTTTKRFKFWSGWKGIRDIVRKIKGVFELLPADSDELLQVNTHQRHVRAMERRRLARDVISRTSFCILGQRLRQSKGKAFTWREGMQLIRRSVYP